MSNGSHTMRVAADLCCCVWCGAKTRAGGSCQAPAMRNGRCRIHGGASTGPRTPEGLARCIAAATKHGRRNAASRARAALRGQARVEVVPVFWTGC